MFNGTLQVKLMFVAAPVSKSQPCSLIIVIFQLAACATALSYSECESAFNVGNGAIVCVCVKKTYPTTTLRNGCLLEPLPDLTCLCKCPIFSCWQCHSRHGSENKFKEPGTAFSPRFPKQHCNRVKGCRPKLASFQLWGVKWFGGL